MSNTRAKFTCTEVSKKTGWGDHKFLYAAKFSAVTGNSDENKTFFAVILRNQCFLLKDIDDEESCPLF